MASRRSTRSGSTRVPPIDPMSPVLMAGDESTQSISKMSASASRSSSGRPRARARSTVKKMAGSKSPKRSVRKARVLDMTGDGMSYLEVAAKGVGSRRSTADASTSISPKSQDALRSSSAGGVEHKDLPLPFDVLWLALTAVAAFLYAVAAVHPDETVTRFADAPTLNRILRVILPVGGTWQIGARCAALFVIGSIPIRRWASNHYAETNVSSDVIVFAVVGVIKLALIQMFMFSADNAVVQSAMLHASLGFAIQELIVNIATSPFTRSMDRAIEIIGNSMILFVAEDDVSLKAMAYTLTTLTLAKVLRDFILITSTRESYHAFRRAVTLGHTALLAVGIPFIANYLIRNAKEMRDDDNPTYAHILTPFICGGVLLSSMVLSHVDYFFN